MTKIERIKVKIEAIEDDPTPKQILSILEDVAALLEEKITIGFRNEK